MNTFILLLWTNPTPFFLQNIRYFGWASANKVLSAYFSNFVKISIFSWTQKFLLWSVMQKLQFQGLMSRHTVANWYQLLTGDIKVLEKAQKKFCFFSRYIYEHPHLLKWFSRQIKSIHLLRDLKRYLYIFMMRPRLIKPMMMMAMKKNIGQYFKWMIIQQYLL